MVETAIRLDESLLDELEALAEARRLDKDTIVSDAISFYLAQQASLPTRAQVDAAYTDDPHDENAQHEEAAFASHRKSALRRSLRSTDDTW